MRTLAVCAGTVFFLISCQKDIHIPNENGGSADTSALGKFIVATGITDSSLKVKLDTLITRARRHSWWDLCNVIYPFAGSTATTCKFNLKDPRDEDEAFRLTYYNSSWTYDAKGVHPGADGYARTYFNPSTQLPGPNNCHLSIYSLDNNVGDSDNADIGCYQNGGHAFYLSAESPVVNNNPYSAWDNFNLSGTGMNGIGFFLMTKDATTGSFYGQSSLMSSHPFTNTMLPNTYVFLCNQNVNYLDPTVYGGGFSQRGLAFATIGLNIDSTIEPLMSADISDFVDSK